MSSFVANGHTVRLHVYQPPEGIPAGVQLVEAAATLPRKHIFRMADSNSVAGFADWFRFQLLHDQGGIWADTDVVCLKPLLYPQSELFGWQDQNVINVAVLGLPAGHELTRCMLECWRHPDRILPYDSSRLRRRKLVRRLLPGDSRRRIEWGEIGPFGFTRAARHLGYERLAVPFWHFYPITFENWHTIFDESLRDNPQLVEASYALHLWNEMARRTPGFDKNARFPPESLFERLCRRYLKNDS